MSPCLAPCRIEPLAMHAPPLGVMQVPNRVEGLSASFSRTPPPPGMLPRDLQIPSTSTADGPAAPPSSAAAAAAALAADARAAEGGRGLLMVG